MRAKSVTIDDARKRVRLRVGVPSGFGLAPRAGLLRYPSEVAAIGNWDVAAAKPALTGDTEMASGWPRVELMPAAGMLLWVLLGDVRHDNGIMPWEGGGPIGRRMIYLAPSGVAARHALVQTEMAPLSRGDLTYSRYPSVTMWRRVVPLAGADGAPAEDPLYLQIFAFAGRGAGSARPLTDALASIEFSYV
jgi:hypothetical protein